MKRSIRQICKVIVGELDSVLGEIDADSTRKMSEMILSAKKIFLAGKGRSGLIAQAFAMRLMLLGLSSHVVGEITTPATSGDDILIVCSGSGETGSTCYTAEAAKKTGARVCCLTSSGESRLAKLSDIAVVIPGTPRVSVEGVRRSVQLGGTLFEQSLLLFLDAMIVDLKDTLHQSDDDMYRRHTNLF